MTTKAYYCDTLNFQGKCNPEWQRMGLELRERQFRDRQFINVDGKYVDFNPCQYKCSLNHLESFRPSSASCEVSGYVGGVATAPVTFTGGCPLGV